MPNYPYYYQPYQPYQPPMADQLMQLRQNQYQPMVQQPMQYQPPQNSYQPAQQSQNGIIWVPNEQAATEYLVAPNNAVALWNSNSPVIYLKQADASGKPHMTIYDLVERSQRPVQTPQAQAVEYAPLSRLEALEARLNELTVVKEAPKAAKKTTTKEEAE